MSCRVRCVDKKWRYQILPLHDHNSADELELALKKAEFLAAK
jgi:hypothetical protein